MKCSLCKGTAHEDEGYFVDGELVCCGCHEEESFYLRTNDEMDGLSEDLSK